MRAAPVAPALPLRPHCGSGGRAPAYVRLLRRDVTQSFFKECGAAKRGEVRFLHFFSLGWIVYKPSFQQLLCIFVIEDVPENHSLLLLSPSTFSPSSQALAKVGLVFPR